MLDTMHERDGPEKRMCAHADSYRCGRHCTLPQTVWVEATQCVTVRILTAFLANSTATEWMFPVVPSAVIFAVRILTVPPCVASTQTVGSIVHCRPQLCESAYDKDCHKCVAPALPFMHSVPSASSTRTLFILWRLGSGTRLCRKTSVRILLFDSVFSCPPPSKLKLSLGP